MIHSNSVGQQNGSPDVKIEFSVHLSVFIGYSDTSEQKEQDKIYLHIYAPTCLSTYLSLPTYLPACLPISASGHLPLPTYLPTYLLPAYQRFWPSASTYLPTYLPTCLPAYQRFWPSVSTYYLHTCLPIYLSICQSTYSMCVGHYRPVWCRDLLDTACNQM